ncbi:MAG: hypothetical protein J0653_03695 [Deltaproteobacteria bacterium]|nr:hypothetical protein [Deltaproteobacteria bacterium]
MRKLLMLLTAVSAIAWAQGYEAVQRSSSPSGLKINDSGQAAGAAAWSNNNAASSGELSNATSSSQQASGKSSVQIQGNTAIKANARNLNSVAAGRNSAAGNEIGAIGK